MNSQPQTLTDTKFKLNPQIIFLFIFPLGVTIFLTTRNPTLLSTLINFLEMRFADFVEVLERVIFFPVGGIPLIISWLMLGGIFCTLRMGFINIRGFKHAIDIVRGKYDTEAEAGQVTHFQALATALSGTVGIGNIAGVAIGIHLGGAGVVFWIAIAGFLGMSIKFVECTLGQKYRLISADGAIKGGPMYYLSTGLDKMGLPRLGKILAAIYAFFCIIGTLGGSNMFQANQSYAAVSNIIPWLENFDWLYGLVLALLVGTVIIGGIERIGLVTEKIVPLMAVIYLSACFWVLFTNLGLISTALHQIITEAFTPQAGYGGLIGVLIMGFRRSAFSSEAGVGSAAIVHSTTRNKEPIREGLVASLEPLIDTVIMCNMTGLVIVVTGVYQDSNFANLSGAQLTAASFATVISWFPIVVAIAGFLFAFSTMISWSYYGERAWAYLWGEKSLIVYKFIFIGCVFFGSMVQLGVVLEFSDMMQLAMTVPNLLGCYLLSNQVAADLRNYFLMLGNK